MNKLDEFKDFIKDKDYLINKVHNNEVSWQTLYETYDLYGKDHELFKNNIKNNSILSKEGINKTINMVKDIDLEKVSSSLESIKKVVNTIQEITKGESSSQVDIPEYMKKSSFKRYND